MNTNAEKDLQSLPSDDSTAERADNILMVYGSIEKTALYREIERMAKLLDISLKEVLPEGE